MPAPSNLKTAVLELRDVFALHLPAEDVPAVLRKAVENALAEVLGDAPKRPVGRPKGAAATVAPQATDGRKYQRSPAMRRKQAEKMRAYWKAKKAAAKSVKPKRRRASAKAAAGTPEAAANAT